MIMKHKIENITFKYIGHNVVFSYTETFNGHRKQTASMCMGDEYTPSQLNGLLFEELPEMYREVFLRLSIFYYDSFKTEYEARASATMGKFITHVEYMEDVNEAGNHVDVAFSATDMTILVDGGLDQPVDEDAVKEQAKIDYFAILKDGLRDELGVKLGGMFAHHSATLTQGEVNAAIESVLEAFMVAEFQRSGQNYKDNIFAMEFYTGLGRKQCDEYQLMADENMVRHATA